MSRPLLIALCSSAMGSGKSTVAKHLVEKHGFIQLAFAAPLKQMTKSMFCEAGMPEDEVQRRVYGDLKEEVIPLFGKSSRQIQQYLGTEFGRELIHNDIWVRITLAKAQGYLDQGLPVVIDDMRFPNELDAVRAAGGYPVRIWRPGIEVTVKHASEGQLDDVTMTTIANDSTVANLLLDADRLVRDLG